MNIDIWWRKKLIAHRVIWLFTLALLLAIAGECICNLRAMETWHSDPEALNLVNFYEREGSSATITQERIVVSALSGDSVLLSNEVVYTALKTVAVTLCGTGPVQVDFLITDAASKYYDQRVFSIVGVADDPILRHIYGYVNSADEVRTLSLRLTNLGAENFSVESVEINVPISFTFSWLRFLIWLTIAFGLGCLAFLRSIPTKCDFNKRWHRLVVVIPLLSLIVLNTVIVGWVNPNTPLLSGRSIEYGQNYDADQYSSLFYSLKNESLSVLAEPSQELLMLENPYDVSERVYYDASYRHDYALFNNRYYVYFGLAPIITIYAPFFWITGKMPTLIDASLLLSWLAVAMVGLAMCELQRRYAPKANVFALSICCVAAVFASGTQFNLVSASVYNLAILSFTCYASGSLALGLLASHVSRPFQRRLYYALSGLCFALTAMSRANMIPVVFVMLLPVYVGDLRAKRAHALEAIAFLIPAAALIGIQLLYNAERFGSPFDFGATHQITVTDVHARYVALTDWPQALYYYLFQPTQAMEVFPFLSLNDTTIPAIGHYIYSWRNAGIMIYPLTWAIPLMPLDGLSWQGKQGTLRRERLVVLGLPLIVSIALMLVSFDMGGVHIRYIGDYLLFFSLAGAVSALPVLSRANTPEQKALSLLSVFICVATLVVGSLLLFANGSDTIKLHSPSVYYGLQRIFYPY